MQTENATSMKLRSQKHLLVNQPRGHYLGAVRCNSRKKLQEHRGAILSNAGILIANCDEDNGEIVKVIDIDDVMSGKLTQFNHWE